MRTRIWLWAWMVVAAGGRLACGLEITCQVVDSKARPVAGAEAAIYERRYEGNQQVVKYRAPLARTDVKGVCRVDVDVVSHRDVIIVARKAGLALAWNGLNPIRNNSLCQGQIFLVMLEPKVLAGTVVDEQERPVADALVQALPADRNLDEMGEPISAPEEWLSVKTDAQGRFKFDCFGPDVHASFHVQTRQRICTYTLTNHVFCGGFDVGNTGIRLRLPKETSVTGRVQALGTGQPVAGVRLSIASEMSVEAGRPCDYVTYTTVSDAQGRYTFAGVPAGPHAIKVVVPEAGVAGWVGSPVSFNFQEGTPPQDINLTVQKGGVVRVRAFDAGSRKALEGVSIGLRQNNEQGYIIARYHTYTLAGGVAEIRVLPGRYRITGTSEHQMPFTDEVIVTDGKTTSLECPLMRRGTMSGKVVDAQGRPVSGVIVRLHPWGDEALSGRDGGFTACYTDSQSVIGAAAFARDIVSNRTAVFDANNVRQFVTLKLSPGLTARGRVVSTAGVPIPAAILSLDMLFPGAISPLGIKTLADANGCFEFKAILPPPPKCQYLLNVNVSGFGTKHRQRVPIVGKDETTVDLGDIGLSPRDKTVSGTVLKANGEPFARGVVIVSGDDQPRIMMLTNERGEFFFPNVCDGPLQIQADMASSPTGSGNTRARGGDRDVKIVIGKSLVHESYHPLLGKKLPSMEKLDIAKSLGSRLPVLLCFWDMEQRPCRALLQQLAGRSSTLQTAGITVLLIHFPQTYKGKAAYERHRDEVQTWVRENHIPYSTDVMPGNVKDTKDNWGIKFLPWLILTDKNHVVCAEGFVIGDLDKVLQEMK
jgi:protocatechuate 3,4-dioxygenase beta subunit